MTLPPFDPIHNIQPEPGLDSDEVPTTMRALFLDGVGFEHLALKRVPTPGCGSSSAVVRWSLSLDHLNFDRSIESPIALYPAGLV